MNINDYDMQPLDHLKKVGRVLDLYADAGNASYAFGDCGDVEAWVVPVREYDEMARAGSWVLSRDALGWMAEDVAGPAYEEATSFALHLDEPGHELTGIKTMHVDAFVGSLPETIKAIRYGRFETLALTRGESPEAIVLTHEEYDELQCAVLEWRQSDVFRRHALLGATP